MSEKYLNRSVLTLSPSSALVQCLVLATAAERCHRYAFSVVHAVSFGIRAVGSGMFLALPCALSASVPVSRISPLFCRDASNADSITVHR